jgi:membrane-anchored glycerophosphoryl diester phosphodiesterase (GDPDase)
MVAALPVGRLMLWMLLVLVIGVVTSFFTFVAIPEIMFSESTAVDAMRHSFQACARNLLALIVFVVLTLIAVVGIYIAVMIVAVFAKLIAGQQAMDVVAQLLATAVLMPVLTGAMYQAWKQMLGGDRADVAATQVGGFEA